MKKVLITGGAGFIGSAIIPEMRTHGYEVHVLDNLSFGKRELADVPDSHFHLVDLRDKVGIKTCIESVQPQIVLHLAAIHFIPYCNKNPYEAAAVNIQGTMNLLDALKTQASFEKLFFASTAAVYPIYDDPIDEGKETGPLDIYGLTKLTGERLCHDFHQESNRPTIICRFFNAFGPNETNPHLIPEVQDQINAGKTSIELGNLEPKRDFIHTWDMAKAVRALVETFEEGYDTFNLGRGEEYSVREVVQAFERQVGHAIEIKQHPDRIRKTDRMHLLANIEKLKAFTGWAPQISLDEGIKTLIRVHEQV